MLIGNLPTDPEELNILAIHMQEVFNKNHGDNEVLVWTLNGMIDLAIQGKGLEAVNTYLNINGSDTETRRILAKTRAQWIEAINSCKDNPVLAKINCIYILAFITYIAEYRDE